ncbi:hypothetical protein SAMN04487939_109113 [Lysobacter sp. yr284]|uniref:hypothetical protein n=1 Tax=Lysobacter sp. yr284 TaxID=1761791 RepID=UPI00089950D6|nr:hypothetical protein [Lysobacter sp. yr284]SDY93970.1 hypothetical protein SAMN04487939_109113 [Lysobacter sp. yr284]
MSAAAAGLAAAAPPAMAWLWWVLAAGAGAAFAASALAGWRWGARRASRARLAARADRNGRELLRIADEIEAYLAQRQGEGASVLAQRHWPRQCRRLALEHLDCINRLMLEGLMLDSATPD